MTVTVAYRMVPGREAEFHSWGWGVLRAGAQQPGFLGGGVLVDGEAEWHVVHRFISEGSWKLWFVNMSAVFPPVLLFKLAILPYLSSLNPLIRTLLLCLAVTAIVTWILMPRLQRFFKKWLYPPLQAIRGRHERRAAQG